MINASDGLELPLPILDILPLGDYSLGALAVGPNLQVGFRGVPDSRPRIAVGVAEESITIHREDRSLTQIESPFVTQQNNGKKQLERRSVLREPVDVLVLRRLEDETEESASGLWVVERSVVEPRNRVGVARFAAKIAEIITIKQKRAEHAAAARLLSAA